jgi:hypothetical protein
MSITKNTIAATFAALLIGGLAISPASAKVDNNDGRLGITDQPAFELQSDSSYVDGRSAPQGTKAILKSNAEGKTNGREG